MTEENQLITERKRKLGLWREAGYDYAIRFDRTHTAFQADEAVKKKTPRAVEDVLKSPTKKIAMAGRIMNLRDMGKLVFLRIRDVSGDFQICLAKDVLGENLKKYLKMLDLGDFCGFFGEFFITHKGESTLLAVEVIPLSKSLRPLPEKWAGLKDREECYRHRYLDLLSNPETLERFKIRSKVVQEIRDFLLKKDFLEVETRTLQPQAGGAMAKVFRTHHNALDHEFVLRISLELDHKILLAGGIERVFEIGKVFRNEGMDPSHLQEFTELEWYAAYADLDDNMAWTEEMIKNVMKNVLGTTKVTVLDKDDKPVDVDFGKKFPHVKFGDLLKKYAKIDMEKASREELAKICQEKYEMAPDEAASTSRGNLLDHIYKKTARPQLIQPTFVLDYPSDVKPLARPKGDGTADCYQLLVAGWEIVNSYGELIDPQVQRKLLEDQSQAKAAGDEEAMDVDEEFLGAMETGMPPMTGFGMGIDRFVALITGQPNLRDVVLFPLMKPEGQGDAPGKAKETKVAVALVNQELGLELWQKMNTVGHLCAALGAREGQSLLMHNHIHTQDKQSIRLNIQHAIMLKSVDSSDAIRKLIAQAEKEGLHIAEFTREMIETTDDKKVVEKTALKNWKDVEYLGVLFFGKKSAVEKLTKDFPLFSGNTTSVPQSSAKRPKDQETNQLINPGITREEAFEILKKYADEALQRHCAFVANAMESLCEHLGETDNREAWYIAGLLHDVDWNHTIDDPESHCGDMLKTILDEHGAHPEMFDIIRSHYPHTQVPLDSNIKKALFACDELSGFTVAVALMRPTKMIGIKPKSITKKMKDKQFAAAVSREDMRMCQEFFDMEMAEFLDILLPGFENIAPEWGLGE